MIRLGNNALKAKDFLSTVTTKQKNDALLEIAKGLRENCETIIQENKIDIENAKKDGLPDGLVDRLMLDEGRINAIAHSVEQVAELPDPCGEILSEYIKENGYVNDITDKRLHHEIYMSDARKVAPEKWKTVIRHPIRKV